MTRETIATILPATVFEWFISLLFGWGMFLNRTLPRMTIDTAGVIVGLVALLLFTLGVHAAGKSASKRLWPHRTWRLKWTIYGVALLFLLFAAGTSLIGLTHQIAWLATSKEPLSRRVYAGYLPAYVPQGSANAMTRNRMKQIGFGVLNYTDISKSMPAGGTFDAQGRAMHSWESPILVYVNYQNPIDFSRPWRDPKNEHHFRSVLDCYINPSFREAEVRNGEGFGLSHYAANVRLMGPNTAVAFDDITDGTSNTAMIGEVNAGFRAWGDPVNWRDPATGFGETAATFGGPPGTGGVKFIMADGSVRLVDAKVDPKVLRALATPSGGD